MNMIQPPLLEGFAYTWQLINVDTGEVVAECTPSHNIIPQVGVDYVAQSLFGDTPPIGSWHLGLFQNDFVPTSATTAADLPAGAGEFTGYSQATRPLWNRVYDGVSVIDNVAARGTFTPTVNQRVYGGFLVSTSTKGGNTGVILSIARFNSPADLVIGQNFLLAAGLTLIPLNVI